MSVAAERGLRTLELAAPGGELVARFAVGDGMAGCSLRHRGEELLATGGGLPAHVEDGALSGIRLLHPWADRLLPIHGALAATSGWEIVGRGSDAQGAWMVGELDFGAHPEQLAVFPFPHRVELAIRVGRDALGIATGVIADRGSPVPLSFGFHPYLALPGVARERWQVTLPAREELELDDRRMLTGASRLRPAAHFVLGERTFDDLVAVPLSPARFSVAGGDRRVTIELRSGYPYAHVFAPAGDPVICFGPMTAPIDALRSHDGLRVLEPGAAARAVFTFAIEDASSRPNGRAQRT
jgi:aldose 1-epimerase